MCRTAHLLPDDCHTDADVREAKALCLSCPVMQECRDWALANSSLTTHGIWGGLTPQQRRTHRRLWHRGTPGASDV